VDKVKNKFKQLYMIRFSSIFLVSSCHNNLYSEVVVH